MKREKKLADRVVQIVLLGLIAWGIFTTAKIFGAGGNKASSFQGGPPGMAGGPPGGFAQMAADNSSNTVAVEAMVLETGTIQEYIRVNGDVGAEKSVSIYPDAAGKLTERLISVGDYVRNGQTLAIVDPSQPGQRYSNSPVYSTINGTITAVNVNIGDTVSQGTAVATVGDLSDLSIVTYIPERYVNAIQNGLVAEMSFAAFPNETFEAKIVEVSPVLDTASRTVEVKLVLTEKDFRIKAGMFASIKLVTKEAKDTLVLPSDAVTSYYGEDVVYIITADNIAERRTVSIGLKSNEVVQIIEGLELGETVITAGLSKISDGSAVNIIEDN